MMKCLSSGAAGTMFNLCCGAAGTMFNLVFVVSFILVRSDLSYFMIGKNVDPPADSLNNFMAVNGVTFLLNDPVAQSGILFALSAFLSTANNVTFQTWRPVSNQSNTFQLINQMPYTPSPPSGGARVDLYLETLNSNECFEVVLGDRLGVYFPVIPSAVTYTVATKASIQTLIYQLPDITSPVLVGDTVSFDPLVFPYDFSLAAYMWFNDTLPGSTHTASNAITCPPGLRIPVSIATTTTTTTQAPRTGAPGATGATGATGYTGGTGQTGNTGQTGAIGLPGATGPVGSIGPLGVKGLTGLAGPPGATGPFGPSGIVGSIGGNGTKGVTGPMGLQGAPGLAAILPTTTTLATNSSNVTSPTTSAFLNIGMDQQASSVDWWRQQGLITGVYIWAAILSFLTLVIIVWSIVLCCCYCQLYQLSKEGRHVKQNGHTSNEIIDAFK